MHIAAGVERRKYLGRRVILQREPCEAGCNLAPEADEHAAAFFGKGIGALGWAVVSDTAPVEAGGVCASLFNAFGNVAGITTPIVIGYLVQGSGSFNSALVFIGANAVVAVLCYLFVVGDIKRMVLTRSVAAQ
jgi:MFS transporter, ACS family, glucarate transporter